MRAFVLVLVVGSGIGLVASEQVRPPSGVVNEAEQRSKDQALNKYGPEMADHSKVILGRITGTWARVYRQWDVAVQAWKKDKEKGSRASAQLAEGVLLDCLSRLRGILAGRLTTELPMQYEVDRYRERAKNASKAFQAAIKADPGLVEARFRDARIRARRDSDARTQLEQLTNERGVIGYLSAIARAETASDLGDLPGAQRWYEFAIARAPGAPAPYFGLASVAPATRVPFEALDSSDAYYNYPCVVLTESVAAELSRRIDLQTKR